MHLQEVHEGLHGGSPVRPDLVGSDHKLLSVHEPPFHKLTEPEGIAVVAFHGRRRWRRGHLPDVGQRRCAVRPDGAIDSFHRDTPAVRAAGAGAAIAKAPHTTQSHTFYLAIICWLAK